MCLILQMKRGWMYLGNRVTDVYLDGVAEFLNVVEKHVVDTNDPWVPCPCCDCKNIKSYINLTQIQTHLIKRGFMVGYDECWSQHGEQESTHDDDYGHDDQSAGESHANREDDVVMLDVHENTTTFPSTRGVHQTNHVHVDTSSQGNTTHEQDALGQMLRDYEENYKDLKLYKKYFV